METLSVNLSIYNIDKLLDYGNGLRRLLEDFRPLPAGLKLQNTELLEVYERYEAGVEKATIAAKISRKELDDDRDDAFRSLMSSGEAASTYRKDPTIQSAGKRFLAMVNGVQRQLTRGSFADQTANTITVLNGIENEYDTFKVIPAFDFYLEEVKATHQAFVEGTNFKADHEATRSAILSASSIRQELMDAIGRFFSKLVILEYEAGKLGNTDQQVKLADLIKRIDTYSQSTTQAILSGGGGPDEGDVDSGEGETPGSEGN